MWLIPNFTTTGFLDSTSLPAASASACAVRRSSSQGLADVDRHVTGRDTRFENGFRG